MSPSHKYTLQEMVDLLEDLRWEYPRTPAFVSKLVDLTSKLGDVEDDVEDAYELIQAIMGEMGEEAVPTLVKEFDSEDPLKKASALALMQEAVRPDNPALIEMVRSAVKHEDERVRHTAQWLFTMTAGKGDLPELIALLPKSDEEFSTSYVGEIAVAMARVGGADALKPLSDLLATAHLSVVNYIIDGLELIGTPEAIQAIRAWKQSERCALYIDTFALMRLEMMANTPKQYDMHTYEQYGREEFRQRESDKLRDDIVLASLKKALAHPALSERAKTALETINTPEAHHILDEWKDNPK